MTIALVAGTRPEVIKMAPVYAALKKIHDMNCMWLSTGQHMQMLQQAQDVFGIRADCELQLMRPGQTPLDIVQSASHKLQTLWQENPPRMVVVQGDTATAFIAALTAFYLKIPVAHVEAGLRSYRIDEPFPEESHRRMIASVAQLHFAPTTGAARNLRCEGIAEEAIHMVGNTVVDALHMLPEGMPLASEGLRQVLVTAHRRENHGERLRNICKALLDIRDAVEDVELVFPVHLNPQVQAVVQELLAEQERIRLIEPQDYFAFVQLMSQSTLILTDSGGVQEEAPSFRVPVLVMREQTERPEAVQAGMAKLVGSNRKVIAEQAIRLLTVEADYQAMRQGESPFGDGHSGEYIAAAIQQYIAER